MKTNTDLISLSFNATLNSENQYFSARLKTDEIYTATSGGKALLDFELTAFDPVSKQSKLRVLYKTNNEQWRFVSVLPSSLHNPKGNYYKLIWNAREGTFSIFVNGISIIDK